MSIDHLKTLAHHRIGGSLVDATRMTGGASQELWALTVGTNAGPADYVLRRAPDDDRMDRGHSPGLAAEAAVIAAVARQGVPVGPVIYVLQDADGLGQGFVARRMPGEALGRRIVQGAAFADVRTRLAAECGTILAHIHATPVGDLPPLAVISPADAIDRMAMALERSGEARPVFETALAWLRAHCLAAVRPALVHGDFRTGNFLLTLDGISAVLDWEGCHIGDPMADLGWLCMPVWRFGRLDLAVGGFGDRAALYDAYAAAAGTPVDVDRVRFWEIFGMMRWGMVCVSMAEAVARGERSIERAAVGRRACEAEIELLHALAPGDADHA